MNHFKINKMLVVVATTEIQNLIKLSASYVFLGSCDFWNVREFLFSNYLIP
jgi:hypothetical protein